MTAFIDTDFERNIKKISPIIGLGLVIAVAALVFLVLNNTAQGLADALRPAETTLVDGTIREAKPGPHAYGDTVMFRSTVNGAESTSNTYVAVVCFQGKKLVFQNVALGQPEFTFENDQLWGPGSASCSTALLYRAVADGVSNVYLLDSVSFEVE